VAATTFLIRLACVLVYHWGCHPIAWVTAMAIEFISSIYLFCIVVRDYFSDDGEGDIERTYLKAVAITYGTAYLTYVLATIVSAQLIPGVSPDPSYLSIHSVTCVYGYSVFFHSPLLVLRHFVDFHFFYLKSIDSFVFAVELSRLRILITHRFYNNSAAIRSDCTVITQRFCSDSQRLNSDHAAIAQ
jgi:hypothetical protein